MSAVLTILSINFAFCLYGNNESSCIIIKGKEYTIIMYPFYYSRSWLTVTSQYSRANEGLHRKLLFELCKYNIVNFEKKNSGFVGEKTFKGR